MADSKVKVVFEGPQGSGKTLLLNAFKTWLHEINIDYDDGGEHDLTVRLLSEDKHFLLTGED